MLQKFADMKGLPVISADTGERVGLLEDMLVTCDKREVAGFVITSRKSVRIGGGKSVDAVLIKDVLKIGTDALIVNSINCIKKISGNEGLCPAKELLEKKVFSKGGNSLGKVADIFFDPKTFRIEAFRISDGLVQDAIYGKKTLPLIGVVEMGSEYVIVEKEAAEEMVNSGGGIKNKFFGNTKIRRKDVIVCKRVLHADCL